LEFKVFITELRDIFSIFSNERIEDLVMTCSIFLVQENFNNLGPFFFKFENLKITSACVPYDIFEESETVCFFVLASGNGHGKTIS